MKKTITAKVSVVELLGEPILKELSKERGFPRFDVTIQNHDPEKKLFVNALFNEEDAGYIIKPGGERAFKVDNLSEMWLDPKEWEIEVWIMLVSVVAMSDEAQGGISQDDILTLLEGKVDKIEGKGLSTNDLTDTVLATINTALQESDLNWCVKNPTWHDSKYILTLPIQWATPLVIDLPVEGLLKGLSYDASTKELVLTLENGTQTRVALNELVVGLASEEYVDTAISTVQEEIGEDKLSIMWPDDIGSINWDSYGLNIQVNNDEESGGHNNVSFSKEGLLLAYNASFSNHISINKDGIGLLADETGAEVHIGGGWPGTGEPYNKAYYNGKEIATTDQIKEGIEDTTSSNYTLRTAGGWEESLRVVQMTETAYDALPRPLDTRILYVLTDT